MANDNNQRPVLPTPFDDDESKPKKKKKRNDFAMGGADDMFSRDDDDDDEGVFTTFAGIRIRQDAGEPRSEQERLARKLGNYTDPGIFSTPDKWTVGARRRDTRKTTVTTNKPKLVNPLREAAAQSRESLKGLLNQVRKPAAAPQGQGQSFKRIAPMTPEPAAAAEDEVKPPTLRDAFRAGFTAGCDHMEPPMGPCKTFDTWEEAFEDFLNRTGGK